MPKTSVLLTLVLLLATLMPTSASAWSKSDAATYAETYALSPNPAWPYLRASDGTPEDCTNFISQALKSGGITMDSTRVDRAQWWMAKNQNGVWNWGYPWAKAQDFYTYMRTSSRTSAYRYYVGTYDWISSSSYPTPPNDNASLGKGDIVSYDFDLDKQDGIDHTAIDTYNGTDANNSSYSGDLVCYHSTDTKRIIWHVKHRRTDSQRQNMRIFCWGLGSDLN